MARYELSDLPKFGDDKNLDPFEFVHQVEFFMKYIDLPVNTPTKVESAIKLFGACVVFFPFSSYYWAGKHLGSRPGLIVKRVKQFCWF